MRRKNYSKLDVKIRYEKEHHAYCIIIDGDVFLADTFEHAIARLFYVLSRDEFVVRDCKRIAKLDVVNSEHAIFDDIPF